ncbi:chymotrypsin family serine protease [Paenibacillus oceani]|uniref:Peptidase S1 domain-containing protein n=1 Tax=Paenibacillus oceani TaxID=2772510 RepID=A0A927CJP1_9BACL|nr:hypothetical protein [Paenibacillus oceani]MBD2866935.1 hypothetical protein [Paenibacillus oceani]
MESGLAIKNESENKMCTIAFSAKDSSGNKFVITAGHCSTNTGVTFSQGGTNFGTVTQTIDNAKVDALKIQLTNPSHASYFLYEPGGNLGGGFIDETEQSEAIAGDPVCFSGYKSGVQCGTIINPDYTFLPTFERVGLANMLGEHGDSGSGIYGDQMFTTYNIHGVLSGIDSFNRIVYSSITHVKSALGITPITESSP